ncbi:MAG: hypothetical protein ACK4FE_06545 [Azonexus sp.]
MDLIGLELIALVVVIGYKMSPILLPKADLTALPDPACDLQKQACAASLPSGGSIELSLGNRPVPLVKPFAVEVVAKGIQPARIAVDFSGVEMNMGYNRPELQPSGAGRFVGEATLPVCITGQMDWQATVLVEAGSQRIAVPFRFTTGEHQ